MERVSTERSSFCIDKNDCFSIFDDEYLSPRALTISKAACVCAHISADKVAPFIIRINSERKKRTWTARWPRS